VRDVSLLLHECYFDDQQIELANLTGHSCVSTVAAVAEKANAKQLALMHIDPLEAEPERLLKTCREHFPHTVLCRDHESISF
jgi:ribonuclease BN (tRNA processing enzyme)